MKKLALILALMIIPCTAFGLEMLTDNSLDNITAQDGVSITVDDVSLFLNVDLFAYVDCDGYDLHNGCTGDGAMVAFSNFQMDTININAMIGTADGVAGSPTYNPAFTQDENLPLASTSCGIPLFYDYADTAPFATCLSSCLFADRATKGLDNYTDPQTFTASPKLYIPQALSIDLTDELPVLSQAYNYIYPSFGGNLKVQGVIITLPTLEIFIQDINFEVAMYDLECSTFVINGGNFGGTADTKNRFGEFVIQDVTFSILSGWLEIAPH